VVHSFIDDFGKEQFAWHVSFVMLYTKEMMVYAKTIRGRIQKASCFFYVAGNPLSSIRKKYQLAQSTQLKRNFERA